MEDRIMCYVCQDFKINVGHETKWCPKNACKKCGQKGHAQMGCMTGKQNLPMPDEILLKILSYLDIKGQFVYSVTKQSCRYIFESGGASSNVVGIICPLWLE